MSNEKLKLYESWSNPINRKDYINQASKHNALLHATMNLAHRSGMSYSELIELSLCYMIEENKQQFDQLLDLRAAVKHDPDLSRQF